MDQSSNLRQIQGLNQRGGRLLTVVDLIEANTLSLEQAAYLLCAVSGGASCVTAAIPGNAGKTTLLACLLTFLPPEVRITTIADAGTLARVASRLEPGSTCYLVHELGDAPFYSYLWGRDVGSFLRLRGPSRSLAACIHADNLEHLREILAGLGVEEDLQRGPGVLAFLRLDETGQGLRRRVTAIHEALGDHRAPRVFNWDPATDRHLLRASPELRGCSEDRRARAQEFLSSLVRDSVRDLAEVRARVVSFLRADPGGTPS